MPRPGTRTPARAARDMATGYSPTPGCNGPCLGHSSGECIAEEAPRERQAEGIDAVGEAMAHMPLNGDVLCRKRIGSHEQRLGRYDLVGVTMHEEHRRVSGARGNRVRA